MQVAGVLNKEESDLLVKHLQRYLDGHQLAWDDADEDALDDLYNKLAGNLS